MMNAEYRAFRVFQRTRLSGERPAPRFSSSCMLNIMTAVPANSCTPRRILPGKAGLLNPRHCKGCRPTGLLDTTICPASPGSVYTGR